MKTEPIEARCHIMTRSFGNGYGDELMWIEDAEEAVDIAFREGQKLPIPSVSDSFISKFKEIIYSDLSDSEIVRALHKLDNEL